MFQDFTHDLEGGGKIRSRYI